MKHHVYLGLGSNLGDRTQNLRLGLRALQPEFDVTAVSALYETAPIGFTDQPAFLNAVCEGDTDRGPDDLLDRLKETERLLGRTPGPVWGPRPLDLDILLYDRLVLATERLQIPHPRLGDRAFVLCPLADLDANLVIPGLERSVSELLSAVGEEGVRRLQAAGWQVLAGEGHDAGSQRPL